MAAPARPRGGAFRVLPERNLRDDDSVSTRVGASQSEDRKPALTCALLQGRPATGIQIKGSAAGTTSIAHKLGRKPVGYFVTNPGPGPFSLPLFVSSDDSFLEVSNTLVASFTVDMWIF